MSRLTSVKNSESESPERIRTGQLSSSTSMSTSRPRTFNSFCQKSSSSSQDINCDKIRAREGKCLMLTLSDVLSSSVPDVPATFSSAVRGSSEEITSVDFPSCSIPNVPAIFSSAERGSPKELTRVDFPSCSVPNVSQVYSLTVRDTPEEITLTSDEDEPSDETSLDIQIW